MYDGLLTLARGITRASNDNDDCCVTKLVLEVLEEDYEPWVEFELVCEYGELAGNIHLDYDDAKALESSEYFNAENCGGTIDQLIYDVLVKDGKVEKHGLRTGYVLGKVFYAAPSKENVYEVPDDERVVFTDISEALAHQRKVKRRKPKRKAA